MSPSLKILFVIIFREWWLFYKANIFLPFHGRLAMISPLIFFVFVLIEIVEK